MAQKVVGLTKNNCGGELSPGSLLYMQGDHPPRCDLVASGLLACLPEYSNFLFCRVLLHEAASTLGFHLWIKSRAGFCPENPMRE
jgi:hypothetical protein